MTSEKRRQFLKLATAGGIGSYLVWQFGPYQQAIAQLPGGTLDPGQIPKFVTPLVIPPAMPAVARSKALDEYSIAVRQFSQQVLPSPLPATTVWGYGSLTDGRTFSYPAHTIEAQADRRVRVKWSNQHVDHDGNFLPHLLAVDQTLHWANPPGGAAGRDMHGFDPRPYRGPVPIVTHLHGHHSTDESDGYPEAWFLPAAKNIPSGFA